MIPQKPITKKTDIAKRIMDNVWGKGAWDEGSPARKYWNRYTKKNFKTLKSMTWREIYKLAKDKIDKD